MAKIGYTNGFEPRSGLSRAARDKRVREIEGEGMDDGRVFIHLHKGYVFYLNGQPCRSVGSKEELDLAMSSIEKED